MSKTVLEVLNESGTPFKESGGNYLIKCLKPENHKNGDRNNSFSIDKEKGMFHCWSCHFSGSFSLLHKLLIGSYIDNNSSYGSLYESNEYQETKKGIPNVSLLGGEILSVYDNEEVMDYLRSIGIYSNDFIDTYRIGYCNYTKFGDPEFKDDKKKVSHFFKRIIFPIFNDGILYSIEARDYTMNPDTKKILYPKGSSTDCIYNIDNVNPNEPLVIVEGIKDLCKVWNYHKNVVSIFTNNFSATKIKMLKDKGFTDNIILFIDNDDAGRRMADSFYEHPRKPELSWGYDFKVAISDIEGQDPNDCSIEKGRKLIENALYYNNWLIKDTNYIEQKEAVWGNF